MSKDVDTFIKSSFGWLEMVNYSADPTDGDSQRKGLAVVSGTLKLWTGTTWTAVGSGSGGITSWDELYDLDKNLAMDDGVLTFTVSTAANGLYLNKTNTGSGVPLIIANSGTGNDLEGPAWSLISTGSVGILELTSAGTINATDGALSIGKTATETSFVGTVSIAEGLTTDDGAVVFTDNSNAAASVSIVNATATTYAGIVKITGAEMLSGTGILATFAKMTTGKALSIVAPKTSSGTLVYLEADEGVITGKYIQCYDGAADDFSVGAKGAVIIGGEAANNVLTVTAGDVVFSDGSITLTDADNASTLVVVNNTITTADLIDISSTSISTTGALMKLNANSTAHDGSILELVSAGDATSTPTGLLVTIADVTTGAAKGISVVMAGATTHATGVSVDMAALTTGTGQLITTAGVMTTTGSLLTLTANAATTAAGLFRINGAGLTSGTAIKVTTTEATLTTGKYLEFYDGAANDFSVAKYGATVIAGNALGTAALTLTAGDVVVTSGHIEVSAGGIQCAAVARTATVAGATTGTIVDGTTYVTVTASDANHIIILPTPTPGNIVWLYVGATGYELRSDTPASVAINGGTGAAAESAIGANVLVRMVCTSSTTWIGTQFSTAGTESAVPVAT